MYHPTLEEFRGLRSQGNLVPIYREIAVDAETPLSAFLKVKRGDYSFLLESVEGDERTARYSFIGTEPYRLFSTREGDKADPFHLIAEELKKHKLVPVSGLPDFCGGAVGYLGYETVRRFEQVPSPDSDPLALPESVLMFVDSLLIFDHAQNKIKIVSHARPDGDLDSAYQAAVKKIDELVKRLRHQFEGNLSILEEQLREVANESTYEYIWAIFGYNQVIKRAIELIKASRKELYVRLFPETARHLDKHLHDASEREVDIRYIAMGEMPLTFDVQIIHPNPEKLVDTLGGYSLDIIADKSEALVGIFQAGNEDYSPINWTRNHWFVIANRDSLRHDFYHYFLHKMYEQKQELSERDKRIYELIKSDN